MSKNYQYKKGVCVHCGRSLMCGKGVAHFKCSYYAQEKIDKIIVEAETTRMSAITQITTILAIAREDTP